jgi:hypothetical protein
MIKMKKLIRSLIIASGGVFPVKLFTRKRNLVFMNNLYHKVAVASACTALSFVLGTSEEAYSATFTLPPAINFGVTDGSSYGSFDGLGDNVLRRIFASVLRGPEGEAAKFTEFNIGSLSFAPNTIISRAIFQAEISTFDVIGLGIFEPINPGSLGIFGYVGNGTAEASDFEAGVFLSSVDVSSLVAGDILNFDVTPFVNQRVSNGDAFAGFGLRALNTGGLALINPDRQPSLVIETADAAEPVPEPTTIFGSAIALGLGGWLKRKNSSQQNKTKSQG